MMLPQAPRGVVIANL